jgi:subtilisin family serine protease
MRAFRLAAFAAILFAAASAGAAEEYLIKFTARTGNDEAVRILGDAGLKSERYFSEIGVYRAEVVDGDLFKKTRGVLESQAIYVERNGTVSISDLPGTLPDDKMLKEQHHLGRTHAVEAWGLSTGSRNVIVAVSDTGVNMEHPDLKNQIWTNPGEVPGDGIDNDGNGFVDDVHGWAFDLKNNQPNDGHGHGTHVSGIIGAEGNNGIGLAGLNWQVTIMPVRFIGPGGSGSTADGIETILYAANNGARVLNCSWSGGDSSQAMLDAINYGYSKGMLTITAAGNSNTSNDSSPSYPNSYGTPAVISVASIQSEGVISRFSNIGHYSVDLAASGEEIISTYRGNGYIRMSGTSMASPVVAGVAGLVLSLRPDLSARELRNALLNAVDLKNSYKLYTATGGHVNAFKALAQLAGGFQLWPQRLVIRQGSEYPFTAFGARGPVTWSVSPAEAATISADGVLQTKELGKLEISATDASGAVVKTAGIEVVEDQALGACFDDKRMRHAPLPVQASAALSLGLPFMVGFVATRPRRRRPAP